MELIARMLSKILYRIWNSYSLDAIAIVVTLRDDKGHTQLMVLHEGNEYTVDAMLKDAAEGEGAYEPSEQSD